MFWLQIFALLCGFHITLSQYPSQTSSPSYRNNQGRASARYGLYHPQANQISLQHPRTKLIIDQTSDINKDASQSDRDWSQWTEWSLCSRTCGGGVAMRTRRCGMRSFSDVIKECSGSDVQHKICNNEPCPGPEVDFRSFQCAEYDKRRLFSSAQFKWTAYYGPDVQPCQLTCMATGYNFYKEFGRVLDGTRCYRDRHDICIEGKCLKVGCDLIVGSNLTEDACGICGGDNSGCYYYASVFTQLPSSVVSFDYHEVAMIPAGATHIRVEDKSTNYLALMEAEGPYVKYVINGNWVISWPGDVVSAGTLMKYSRNDNVETLEARGPTTKDLHVMILYLGGETAVEYEYWAPNGVRSNQYSALEGAEVTRDDQGDTEYYDSLYDDWSVVEVETIPKPTTATTTTTSTTTTTTTTATTTTTTASTTSTKSTTAKKTKKEKKKRKKPDYCKPCRKPRNKKKHFCLSDFVIHAEILSKNKVEGKRYRHDINVRSVFKSDFHLTSREYLWVYSNCCPKLRPFREYLIMGRKRKVRIGRSGRGIFQSLYNETVEAASRVVPRFETRLVVDYLDYWHPWKQKYEMKLNKLANKVNCSRISATRPPISVRDPERRSMRRRRIERRRRQ